MGRKIETASKAGQVMNWITATAVVTLIAAAGDLAMDGEADLYGLLDAPADTGPEAWDTAGQIEGCLVEMFGEPNAPGGGAALAEGAEQVFFDLAVQDADGNYFIPDYLLNEDGTINCDAMEAELG